jgi:head-tail adaptor
MAGFTIDAGRLNRQLVLEAPSGAADGAGGIAPGFAETARFFAAVDPLGPEERDDTGFALTARLFRVTLRFRADLTLAHRFRLGSRVLSLEGLADPDERGRFLVALCREEAP